MIRVSVHDACNTVCVCVCMHASGLVVRHTNSTNKQQLLQEVPHYIHNTNTLLPCQLDISMFYTASVYASTQHCVLVLMCPTIRDSIYSRKLVGKSYTPQGLLHTILVHWPHHWQAQHGRYQKKKHSQEKEEDGLQGKYL